MSKNNKYSDAPVDEKDKGTIVESLVLGGFLKGDWRDHKVENTDCDNCKVDDGCGCKEPHLKVVK